MKAIKWLIGVLVAVFTLLVIGVVILVNFVNPNDYREQINHVISDKIHKPFAINGEISWVLFPSLGFKAQNMTIGDRHTQDLYVELSTLELNLQLLPLLHKNIALNALHIDGAQIILPSDAHDVNTATQTNGSDNLAAAMLALPDLSLKAFSIKNANLTKQKPNGAVLWQIKNLAEEITELSWDKPFTETADFNFSYPDKNISAKINFKTDMEINTHTQTIRLFSPKLVVENSGSELFTGTIRINMHQLTADLGRENLLLEKLSGNLNQLNFAGEASVNHFLNNPAAQGQLALKSDQLKSFLQSVHITLPQMQSASALSHFALTTHFQYANNQLQANPLTIELDQATINGSITSSDVKNLALEVKLSTPHFDLGNYLKASNPADAKKMTLENSQCNVKLLPPVGNEQSLLASTASGFLTIKKLTINDQSLGNLSLLVDAKNQMIKIIKLHSELWQGAVDASGFINLQHGATEFTLNPQIQHMEIKNLMALLEPKFKISGSVNLNGSINSVGSSLGMIKQNLTGHLNLRVNNGILHGIDISYWLKAADNVLRKQSLPQQPSNPETNFGTLTASLSMNRGLISNPDLLMAGPTLYVTGQGSVNLPSETLNYHLFLAKTNTDTGAAHHDVIPLLISGSFDHPSIDLDLAALTKKIIGKELDKQKDKLLEKALGSQLAQSQVGQQLGDALGKLFH